MKYELKILVEANKPYLVLDEKGKEFPLRFERDFLVKIPFNLDEPETTKPKQVEKKPELKPQPKKEVVESKIELEPEPEQQIKEGEITKEDYEKVAGQKVTEDELPKGLRRA